ncbi:Ank2 [Symbiodinium natans]|uniref:Ank2 protein n=1 Tax=Symbiodinium natans TaxID=878477 RepID=A0A812Q8S1_9DINO|nr:Ank2 [Symbiodinium natans]
MLRVLRLSGEELASLPTTEIEVATEATPKLTVRVWKKHLQGLCGVARFRQRLLQEGHVLDEDAEPDYSLDALLVLLPFTDPGIEEREELSRAANGGLESQVEALLQRPQNPNLLDSHGQAPLAHAAWQGHTQTARLLLEAGAEVDLLGSFGRTALHMASEAGHVEVAQLLLAAGADVSLGIVDGGLAGGVTAFHLASSRNCVDILQLLMQARAKADMPVAAGPLAGLTALMAASEAGSVESAGFLLEARADMDAADASQRVAIHWASVRGRVGVVRLLLQAGADKDVVEGGGCTALHLASLFGQAEVARILLEAGAKLDKVTKCGFTALPLAAFGGHGDIARLLLLFDPGTRSIQDGNSDWQAFLAALSKGRVAVWLLVPSSCKVLRTCAIHSPGILTACLLALMILILSKHTV